MKKKDLNSERLKELSVLLKEVDEKKREIALLFAKVKSGQEKNTSKLRNLKRDLARVLTIVREKEIIEQEKRKENEK